MTLLILKILRGVDLPACDNYLIQKSSSDPYCQVYLNKKHIGRTPVQKQTLNPIFGGPMSTYKFEADDSAEIIIHIFDFDNLTSDDPMGKVSFRVSELLGECEGYPNVWLPLKSLNGAPSSGKLELRLMRPSEPIECSNPSVIGPVTAGPKLKGTAKRDFKNMVKEATTPVTLHVYNVGHNANVSKINAVCKTTGAGGIFHGAIEVYGREFSFGGSRMNQTGIFNCNPRKCPMHEYRESIFLGDCELSKDDVKKIIRKMQPEWMAPTYDLLRKNCCFFSKEFAIELGVGSIPEWVYSLADVGAKLDDFKKNKGSASTTTSTNVPDARDDSDAEDTTLDHVMAARMQRAYRTKKSIITPPTSNESVQVTL